MLYISWIWYHSYLVDNTGFKPSLLYSKVCSFLAVCFPGLVMKLQIMYSGKYTRIQCFLAYIVCCQPPTSDHKEKWYWRKAKFIERVEVKNIILKKTSVVPRKGGSEKCICRLSDLDSGNLRWFFLRGDNLSYYWVLTVQI